MAGKPSIRRTKEIALGVAMTAMIMAGCDSDDLDEKRRCVDKTGRVVAETNCMDDEAKKRYHGSGGGSFFYYYGGSGYSVGETVRDGSVTPRRVSARSGSVSTSSASSRGSASRGGFGASASAHGGSAG